MSESESSKKAKRPKISSKGSLAIALSKLRTFENPKVSAEQYPSDPEIAASVLWNMHMQQDIPKVSVDMGSGTGILGIGLLLLGAPKVHFVDSDPSAIALAEENLNSAESEYSVPGEAVFHTQDISSFSEPVGLVLQNPPFGVKVRHADRKFLEQAVKIGKVIYSFHKSESKSFISKFSTENGFKLTNIFDFDWPLKASYSFHSRRIKHIPVSCFRLEKQE